MTVASMTGFATVSGAFAASGAGPDGTDGGDTAGDRWRWDIKSVNGRGLDVRMRCPAGLDMLEPEIRKRVSTALTRGSVSVTLQMERPQAAAGLSIDDAAFADAARRLCALADQHGVARPSTDGLLQLRGMLRADDPVPADDAATERLHDALLVSLDDALAALQEMRLREGGHLAAAIADQLDRIAGLANDLDGLPERAPQAIADRIAASVRDLVATASELDADRLAQEALLIAQKQDVREEIDRLRAHVSSGRDLLAEGRTIGRRLDFLTQELNREANTICSKSNSLEQTRIGLDLKAVIDQVREQVQNIE